MTKLNTPFRSALTIAVLAVSAILVPASLADIGCEDLEKFAPPLSAQTDKAVLMTRIGLTADVLCAAGVQVQEIQPLIGAIFAEVANQKSTLRTLDASRAVAKSDCDGIQRKVRSGLASKAQVMALSSAKTTFARCSGAVSNCITTLRAAGLATLPSSTAATLKTMNVNAGWKVPAEYLLDTHTERQWVQLRDDLATERINTKLGEAIPSSTAGALSSIRSGVNVSRAKVDLDTNFASVQQAWNDAVTP